jgi:hypothetical protein
MLVAGHIGEADARSEKLAGLVGQGNDLDVPIGCFPSLLEPGNLLQGDRALFGGRLLDARPQFGRTIGDFEILNRAASIVRSEAE